MGGVVLNILVLPCLLVMLVVGIFRQGAMFLIIAMLYIFFGRLIIQYFGRRGSRYAVVMEKLSAVLVMAGFGFLLRTVNSTLIAGCAVGALLNAVAMIANGGYMPVAPEKLNGFPLLYEKLQAGQSRYHRLAGPETRLHCLIDRWTHPLFFCGVGSVGDAMIYSGVFLATIQFCFMS